MSKKVGFTLVEVIIVVAIISILASIILPKMGASRERAKLNACKSNLRHIGMAAEMYCNEYGKYASAAGINSEYINDTHRFVTLGFLKSAPRCPSQTGTGASYGDDWQEAVAGVGLVSTFHTYCVGTKHSYFNLPLNNPRWDIQHGGIRETDHDFD